MIQNGQPLQFVSSGDETEIPFVQLDVAASGQENSPPPGIPVVRLDGGPFIKKVQITTSGNPARIPKVRIPHLAAWFKFNKGITVTGAGVSQWDDQSGNGRHLKQGTDTNRPALQADGSILFDGADNYLVTDAFNIEQPFTRYVLFSAIAWTGNDCIWVGAADCRSRQVTATPQIDFNCGSSIGTVSPTLGTYNVLCCVGNGASSVLQLNNDTPVTGNAGAGGIDGLWLGSSTTPANFGNIQAKEDITFSAAHDADTRRRVIRYLASVGGLSF